MRYASGQAPSWSSLELGSGTPGESWSNNFFRTLIMSSRSSRSENSWPVAGKAKGFFLRQRKSHMWHVWNDMQWGSLLLILVVFLMEGYQHRIREPNPTSRDWDPKLYHNQLKISAPLETLASLPCFSQGHRIFNVIIHDESMVNRIVCWRSPVWWSWKD